MIAAALRTQILNGTLREGDFLPPQEYLLERYQAGLPAVREALRILELEGLISVRRGNQGGAVVHLPTINQTAYMSALVMESRKTRLQDLAEALRQLEPICARLCAEREDRAEVVVPALEKQVQALRDNLDSEPAVFNDLAHGFHRELVEHCGNEALRVTVGCLGFVWSAHERAYADRAGAEGTFPGRAPRIQACEAHERILETVVKGDGAGAARRATAHAAAVQQHHFASDDNEYVIASLLQSYYLQRP
jgi:GntR family transcriptional repressor for pyruvate dehydrogenase complex